MIPLNFFIKNKVYTVKSLGSKDFSTVKIFTKLRNLDCQKL